MKKIDASMGAGTKFSKILMPQIAHEYFYRLASMFRLSIWMSEKNCSHSIKEGRRDEKFDSTQLSYFTGTEKY